MKSIEQMVRDILTRAMQDGLVGPTIIYKDPDPQIRSSGELVGPANLLQMMLREYIEGAEERGRAKEREACDDTARYYGPREKQ